MSIDEWHWHHSHASSRLGLSSLEIELLSRRQAASCYFENDINGPAHLIYGLDAAVWILKTTLLLAMQEMHAI